MFARITPYKMKPGSKDAAIAIMNSLKDKIMALPGQKHFLNVMDKNGSGYVISLTELAETPPDTAEKIKALWGAFSDHLEAMPTPGSFEVLADWKH